MTMLFFDNNVILVTFSFSISTQIFAIEKYDVVTYTVISRFEYVPTGSTGYDPQDTQEIAQYSTLAIYCVDASN